MGVSPNCSPTRASRWPGARSPSTVKRWVSQPPMSAGAQDRNLCKQTQARRRRMQLNVTGHHVEVTPSLRGYVEKKLERIGRHFDQVIDVHCVLTVEKLRQKAEATLHVSGSSIYAGATQEDMYAAIDLLADKLDRCIKKHKEKRADHHAAAVRALRL